MKLVTAFIQSHKLSDVTLALQQIEGLSGASVSDVHGFGRGRAKDAKGSVVYNSLDYLHRIRVEVACSDNLLDDVISTIEATAVTGLRGDGKIYVNSLEQAIRISTGERGDDAV